MLSGALLQVTSGAYLSSACLTSAPLKSCFKLNSKAEIVYGAAKVESARWLSEGVMHHPSLQNRKLKFDSVQCVGCNGIRGSPCTWGLSTCISCIVNVSDSWYLKTSFCSLTTDDVD